MSNFSLSEGSGLQCAEFLVCLEDKGSEHRTRLCFALLPLNSDSVSSGVSAPNNVPAYFFVPRLSIAFCEAPPNEEILPPCSPSREFGISNAVLRIDGHYHADNCNSDNFGGTNRELHVAAGGELNRKNFRQRDPHR